MAYQSRRLVGRLREAVAEGSGRLVADAGGLFGTAVVTAGFGSIYWVIAARLVPPQAIGAGGAAISAMTLISRVGTVGLGTLLLGEVYSHPGRERALVWSSSAIA